MLHFVQGSSDNEKQPMVLLTAQRALAFLEAVALAERPPTIKEVSAELAINITTAYHLLNTLRQSGYLVKDADGTLRVGARASVLYQGMLRHLVLGRDLRPVIEQLATETDETAYLASHGRDRVVIEAVVEARQAVRVSGLYVGYSGSEHRRASGKAVMAFLNPEGREALITRCFSGLSAAARRQELAQLNTQLETIRAQGWAMDDQEFQPSVCCAAAPFFRADASVAGSVTVSVPSVRFYANRDALVIAVRKAAAEISTLLGHVQQPPVGKPLISLYEMQFNY
jgi:DNA-binding IclR family transcriptional regulator